jgi:hypothetical protein
MVETKHTHGYTVTRDNALILHPGVDGSISVPQADTTYGAGFGDSISDGDRAFAACREPIAHFLTYIVAADMVDKWFVVNDPDTEEADPELDRSIQEQLTALKFKRYLRVAIESARIYGRSLLVGGFSDAKDVSALSKPRSKGAQLLQLAVYPETYQQAKVKEFMVETIDTNPVSPRYTLPVTYKLVRQSTNESGQAVSDNITVHYTRCVELGDGTSVLDKVWDDMGCGRNIRWGAAQWMYRTGSGFPVVGFPAGTTATQLQDWFTSGMFDNLMSRTGIFIAQNSIQENTGMTFDFKGPAGVSLDPTPFYTSNIQQIAIATGYPQAKLIGAQAGAVTGSEVNQQEYYKAISRDQESYCEEPIRWVLSCLAESGQANLIKTASDKRGFTFFNKLFRRDYRHKAVSNYVIEWNSAFELSELDEEQVAFTHAQTQEKKLGWMSKDEIRAEEGLDPLPDGAGEWKDQTDMFGGEEFLVKSKQGMKPNGKQPEDEKPKDTAGSDGSPCSH